jgi:diguanylate cyclase (GGDEF)-like protein
MWGESTVIEILALTVMAQYTDATIGMKYTDGNFFRNFFRGKETNPWFPIPACQHATALQACVKWSTNLRRPSSATKLKYGQVREFESSRPLEAAPLMNFSRLPAQAFNRSIFSLQQAVLDALPEALFLIDPSTGQMRSLNAAAAKWTPPQYSGDATWNIVRLLPELNLTKLSDWASSFHLGRAMGTDGTRRDVVLHLYPFVGDDVRMPNSQIQDFDDKTESNSRLLILGLRPFGTSSDLKEPLYQDAYHDAFHDPLTRLPNRRLFHRRLERIVERASRANHHFAVLFVDLDRFKSVNDQFGHVLGDKLLISAARRLVEAVRPQDMVARRDGDEFTILLDDLDRPEDAVGVAQRIIECLQMPLLVESPDVEVATVEIGASIGIAIASDGTLTAEELIACADAAMYHAKAIGGGVFLAKDGLRGYRDEFPARKKPLPR